MGKETEVVAQSEQGIFMNSDFPIAVEICENSPVLPQQPMNVPNKIVRVAVNPVIIIIPALIRTEFLIGSATNGVAAIETFLFHSTNVSIKI